MELIINLRSRPYIARQIYPDHQDIKPRCLPPLKQSVEAENPSLAVPEKPPHG